MLLFYKKTKEKKLMCMHGSQTSCITNW